MVKVIDKIEIEKEVQSVENGVFIQGINGELWKIEDWSPNYTANAIAVITPQHRFMVALHDCEGAFSMTEYDGGDKLSEVLRTTIARAEAEEDYGGLSNTMRIAEVQPDSFYAAAACLEFEFPNHATKGYLPSLGELCIIHRNIAAINKALAICGGSRIMPLYYWSSTFGGKIGYHGCCIWRIGLQDGYTYKGDAICFGRVRPCARYIIHHPHESAFHPI